MSVHHRAGEVRAAQVGIVEAAVAHVGFDERADNYPAITSRMPWTMWCSRSSA